MRLDVETACIANATTEPAIEVTEEMIAAGVAAIPRWAVDYSEIVECAYVAMERARRLCQTSCHS
jgi:hypothetical protein